MLESLKQSSVLLQIRIQCGKISPVSWPNGCGNAITSCGSEIEIPRAFIGSSKESLDIANAMQLGLARDPVIVTVWTNGVFGPSSYRGS